MAKQTRVQPRTPTKVIASKPGHPPTSGSPVDLSNVPATQIRGER